MFNGFIDVRKEKVPNAKSCDEGWCKDQCNEDLVCTFPVEQAAKEMRITQMRQPHADCDKCSCQRSYCLRLSLSVRLQCLRGGRQ
jgi:hypothetical protein